MVDSCRVCENCKAGVEPHCAKGMVGTDNARDYKRQPDLRRLLQQPRRRRALCPHPLAETRYGRRCPAPLRRHHHLLRVKHWQVGRGNASDSAPRPHGTQVRLDGTLCSVGLPEKPLSVTPFAIRLHDGMAETQQMLHYCADHGIELTSIDKLSEAYDRLIKGDVKYRLVIDMATLPTA